MATGTHHKHPKGGHKRPESVLIVVHTGDGKVLLMRRTDHPEFWQSVTGSLRWDESNPHDAAVRELEEETGLTDVSRLRETGIQNQYEIFPEWRYRYAPGTTHNTEHVFFLALDTEAPITLNDSEHTEYCWLTINDALARVSSSTNHDAIELLIQDREGRE